MCKCLYCYQELEKGQTDFHPACARRFFGSNTAPILPYTRDNMSELARQVIRTIHVDTFGVEYEDPVTIKNEE